MLLELFYMPGVILLALTVFYINRQKINPGIRTLFLAYLAINFCVELTANILELNIILYNAAMIFEVVIFMVIYYRSFPEIWARNAIRYMILFFIFFAIINAAFFQYYTRFFSHTYIAGCILLMFISLYYLFFFVIKYEVSNPLKNLLFWFSLGVLFCYLGNLPYLVVLNNIISIENKSINQNLKIISKVVNTLLYLLILIGSICQVNTKQLATK